MATASRERFIHAQTAWMLGVVLVLTAIGSLSLELFFVLSLVGFLIVVELTAPLSVTPSWRRRLWWVILVGLLGFGYLIVRRILALLPWGVL